MPALRQVGSTLAYPFNGSDASGIHGRQAQKPVSGGCLLADTHLQNYSLVPLGSSLFQIVKQATTPADHHEKTAARSVVLLMRTEVLSQLTDAPAEKGNLDFRAACVGGVGLIRLDDIGFLLSS
jgi:hypothetical protein